MPASKQGIEREFKFLIKRLPPNLARYEHKQIEQGYLAIPKPDSDSEIRIRRADRQYVITVKIGRGSARRETEVPIPSSSARKLWPLTKGRRISKVRYKIPYHGLTIEIDVYRGKHRGLAVAEVEFPSASAMRKFRPPQWLGRDVTGQPAFSNSRLATSAANPAKLSRRKSTHGA